MLQSSVRFSQQYGIAHIIEMILFRVVGVAGEGLEVGNRGSKKAYPTSS